MHPTPSPFPRKTNALGAEGGGCFLGGRGPGRSRWRHTPWGRGLEVLAAAAALPVAQPPLPGLRLSVRAADRSEGIPPAGSARPSRLAAPFPPAPDTLTRPREKWVCCAFRVDEGLRAGGPSPDAQPSRPSPAGNYLLAFSGCRGLGRSSGRWGGGDIPRRPPARRAARLHPASGGLGPRPPRRLGSPSRGAGRTMELGRVQRRAASLRRRGWAGAARAEGPRSGALTHRKAKSPCSDFDLQVLFLPLKAATAGAVPSVPLAVTRRRRAPSSGKAGRVSGWVPGSDVVPTRFLYFPSVQLCAHLPWSFCLPYLLPTSFLLPLLHPHPQQVRESETNCIFSLMTADGREKSAYR